MSKSTIADFGRQMHAEYRKPASMPQRHWVV
jgi:hypothetical protein